MHRDRQPAQHVGEQRNGLALGMDLAADEAVGFDRHQADVALDRAVGIGRCHLLRRAGQGAGRHGGGLVQRDDRLPVVRRGGADQDAHAALWNG